MGFLTGLMAALGLMVTVLAAGAWIARRRFRAAGGAFRCRVRMPTGRRPRRWRPGWRQWPLRRTCARWIHDVLLLQAGPLGLSVLPLAARPASGAVLRPVPAAQARGLGPHPWALLLTTEERVAVDVAVAESDRVLLVGPYLTAALSDLPTAPREKGV